MPRPLRAPDRGPLWADEPDHPVGARKEVNSVQGERKQCEVTLRTTFGLPVSDLTLWRGLEQRRESLGEARQN
jgi:hypothetical protein